MSAASSPCVLCLVVDSWFLITLLVHLTLLKSSLLINAIAWREAITLSSLASSVASAAVSTNIELNESMKVGK